MPAQSAQLLKCTVPGCNKSFQTPQSRVQHVRSAAHRKKEKATEAQSSVQAVSMTISKPLPTIEHPIATHCTNPVVESTMNNIRIEAPHTATHQSDAFQSNLEKRESGGRQRQPPNASMATQKSVLEISTLPIQTPIFRWDTRWSAISAAQYVSTERALRALVSTPAISTTLDKVFWTPDNTVAPEHDPAIQKRRAIVLDCEMIGVGPKATTSELARLSAIDWFTGELLIDALVQPVCAVTDWRTKWSGITAEIMEVAVISGDAFNGSSEARAELFKHMDSEKVLVGHALHYDLAALGIHHNVVVDSAVLAKKAVGKNVKRDWGLKMLCKELLGVTVQAHGNDGHDSVEDALAAKEVVLWCLEHNAELTKWGRQKKKEYDANNKKKPALKKKERYTKVSRLLDYDESNQSDYRCVSLQEFNEMCGYPAWYDNWSD